MSAETVTRATGPLGIPRQRVGSASQQQPQKRWRSEGTVLFLAAATAYLALAVVFLHADVVFPDAVSRLANGFYVLFSRDPHLPAVGFVWNPLPSVVALPLLCLKAVFPGLVRDGLAGGIESAIFMAWAVALMAGCLQALGVARLPRLVLTLAFALHPLVFVYGGSGQSEAPLLCFLLLAVRCLIRWLRDDRPQALVGVGVALGLAYWTRYEAVGPALVVTLLVGAVSFARATDARRSRALTDMALAGLPFAFSFTTWAVASKVIVGSWFETFTSDYGNSAQVSGQQRFIGGVAGDSVGPRLRYAADQLLGLEPVVPVLLVALVVLAWRRRDLRALAAPAVLGAVLAFDNLAFLTGGSFGWLRFQIAVVPLAVLLAGGLLVPATARRARGTALPRLAALLVIAAALSAIPVSIHTLADHRLAREETLTMLAAWAPDKAEPADQQHLNFYDGDDAAAAALDSMHLPEGAVLADAAYAYRIVLRSHSPRQLVITPDRDFPAALADPAGHGVRYLLVSSSSDSRDALEQAHPGLYATGTGAGPLAGQWAGVHASWRLYAVR